MSLAKLLEGWKRDPLTAENIVCWRRIPPRAADWHPFPGDLPLALRAALADLGVTALYSHQALAWERARAGEHVALATGTASGKSLAYNLPVLATLLEDPDARALYLFPTKALAQDQLAGLTLFEERIESLRAAIYDGDTPQRERASIRGKVRLVLTNPDMLHTGILPHHTVWMEFFRALRFVVVDEVHTYRGIFGSHVANVLRRLKRVAAFYGTSPQFLLASATIGNPGELAERLVEAPVTLVDKDGSARGERHFLIYNPPIVDAALGLRASTLLESVRLGQEVLSAGAQSVIFSRSRRSVEIMLTYLRGGPTLQPPQNGMNLGQSGGGGVRGYRSGYLPAQRREIEAGLRDGSIRSVVATNALELGIDIGGLEVALLAGYPGTIASTWQQAGRAGRGEAPAAAVLVASSLPLDQYLAHHPEYFFERSPEHGLIDPDHLLILLEHLRCATFELPFEQGERFGGQDVAEFLEYLVSNGQAHRSGTKTFWMADKYPAAGISLRSASPESVLIRTIGDPPTIIGQVDRGSAAWMVHPGAIYLHAGEQYFVHALDLEQGIASVSATSPDHYTQAQRRTELTLLADLARTPVPGGEKGYGEIKVTSQVTGYKKLRWFTHENLGEEPLDLPPGEMQTTAYWLGLSEEALAQLRAEGIWSNDPNDYGPDWPQIRAAARARDGYRCQVCGVPEGDRQHEVHHRTPFRAFRDAEGAHDARRANRFDNLVTLCPACHRKVEQNVRVRSGLAGVGTVLGQLAPLYLMCDPGDLGVHSDPGATVTGVPAVILFDEIPAGIGFSQKLFELHDRLVGSARELVGECPCTDGCPSCVGPGGENGSGGKREALAILERLAQGAA